MSPMLDNIVSAYKTLAKLPSVVGGTLNNAGNTITAKWSVRNVDKGKSTKYVTNYTLDENLKVTSESAFGADVSNVLLEAVSPRETYKALITEEKEGKDDKKQYLEVWKKNTLAHCIDLTALDIHGDVYADSEFGTLDWTQDETEIVYVAEKTLPKCEPYIKRKGEQKNTDDTREPAAKKGKEYLYRQDWGEQLQGKHLSVIVICSLSTETFTVLTGLPDDWCPGQVRFTADGTSVVGVAWPTEPSRLGLIFCTNRPSYIFSLTRDGRMRKLSEDGNSVRSPRFGPCGDLIWLQRPSGGPHHACHKLVRLRHISDPHSCETVIDIVQHNVEVAQESRFHGIYSLSLPRNCFSSDGKRIVFSTPQVHRIVSYVTNLESKSLVDISQSLSQYSLTVLDIKSDVILATCSNMKTPGQLYVTRLPPQGSEGVIIWTRVTPPWDVPQQLATSNVEHLEFRHSDSDDAIDSFSAIYLAPAMDGIKLPLLVWPHGGPHSNFVNSYSLEAALFNAMGFAILQVNYRGSTGAGQAIVDFLPKHVGQADVEDCKLATDKVVKMFSIDENKLCLYGGSHGGFLVAHLSGQYPDTYKAVVARNPVIDVASMANSTDIADWCAVEAGFQYDEAGAVSEEQLVAMRRCSPLVHVHAVRAPTALMLGSQDKRVPLFQGLEYARRLRANGIPTRVYMYNDNHSLSSLTTEIDNLINSVHWLLQHLNVDDNGRKGSQ